MEKKKDNKFTPPSQEAETNEFLTKEDQNQTGVGLAKKNPKTSSPSLDNVASVSILQWPYTPQPAVEQFPLISRPSLPSLPTQQPPPVVLNRWQTSLFNPQQQPQQQQQNPINHLQNGPPSSQLTQSTGAFWLPPRPGFHVPGAAAYHPFAPMGTVDSNWQTSVVAGGASSRNEPYAPGFCYQGGYSSPMGFPGHWDPSSWWGQAQQSQPPCTYTSSGPYVYFSLPPPPVPDSSVAFGQPYQRGIIRSQLKLSQKHQQMWEAQSWENVQMWAAIGHLQADMAAYGTRFMKLEAEISSLKSTVEVSAGAGAGALAGQALKRARPKRVASVDVLPSTDVSKPRSRGRKPAPCKVQSETKVIISDKESLNKDKEKTCQPAPGTAIIQRENDGKISNIFINSGDGFELNGSNLKLPLDVKAKSTFHSQVHGDISGVQIGGVSLNPTSEMKANDNKLEDQKTAFSILTQHLKEANTEANSTTYRGTMNNESRGWASNILSNNPKRNLLDVKSHAFYNDGNVITQGGKLVPGWSFMSEEDASEEHEDVIEGSGKDDDEEMEEDASSGADETAPTKAEGVYEMNFPGGTSPKVLPQLNRW